MSGTCSDRPSASVVIPAHNESVVIRRLLSALTIPADVGLEIVVVCNGCTDGTEQVAGEFAADVEVISLPEASKRLALRRGDQIATVYPRFYIDADVEVSSGDVRAMIDCLVATGALAVAPERLIPRDGVSLAVRWYYDVWERLPQVRTGLFGRGVIGVSESGSKRIRTLPLMMGDDLVASESFVSDERCIASGAVSIVRPPRTSADLYRRRVRAITGNAQADDSGLRQPESRTTPADLFAVARDRPRMAPKVAVFLAFTLAARLGARSAVRRGDFDSWLRDESSRG